LKDLHENRRTLRHHDQIDLIIKAVELFNAQKVDLVVHCGDWVSPFILQHFKKLKAPIKGVFGNNDGDKFRHLLFREKHKLDIDYEDRFLDIELDGKRIAVFHGDYAGIVEALVKCGTYDAVFHGHTHERVKVLIGKTLSFNPGSLMAKTSPNLTGASIGIYDTTSNTAEHLFL
jgi:uncharacterized protein